MKIFNAVLVAALVSTACSQNSDSNRPQEDVEQTPTKNKIEPGYSLYFVCPDEFNDTSVKISSVWDVETSLWVVSIEEIDRAGNKILKIEGLIGYPDDIEDLHMHIKNNLGIYAKIIQIGESESQFSDGKRVLDCSFK